MVVPHFCWIQLSRQGDKSKILQSILLMCIARGIYESKLPQAI